MPGGWPWDFGHQQYKSESETLFFEGQPSQNKALFKQNKGPHLGSRKIVETKKKVFAWLLSINFTPKTSHSCLKNAKKTCFPSDLKIPKSCPTQIYSTFHLLPENLDFR